MIIIFQFSNPQVFISAQEVTSSVQPTNEASLSTTPIVLPLTPSPTETPQPSPIEILQENQTATSSSSLFNSILEPTPAKTSQPAASIRAKRKIRKLPKKDFQLTEDVGVLIENAELGEAQVDVVNSSGQTVDLEIAEEEKSEGVEIVVVPPKEIKPGRYTLEIEAGGQLSKQDFTWGVLAINTNKSIYTPQEQVSFAFAVLNESGEMVCDADLSLEITNPAQKIDVLSTENGKIETNRQCSSKELSLVPDYEASYQTEGVGKYNLKLVANTSSGSYTVTDSFETRDSAFFDIERIGPTRIYPPLDYPVTFKITANQDFEGEIIEVVPFDFDIKESDQEGAKQYDKILYGPSSESESKSPTISLRLPFDGEYRMLLGFGYEPDDPLLQSKYEQAGVLGHDGVDFDLPMGTPVLAVAEGTVALAQENGDYGTTIVLEHGWGKTYYGHLSSFSVSAGQEVKKGDEIGRSGSTGLSTGPHLHFGLKPKENDFGNGYFGKVDPLLYFGKEFKAETLSSPANEKSRAKLITWNVAIKKGESVTLGYSFRAPKISPQFYLLGPLSFKDSATSKPIFEEIRQWQIAADSTITFSNLGASAGTPTAPDFTSGTFGNTHATASWTPPTSGLIFVYVYEFLDSGSPGLPSMSGNSITWTRIASVQDATGGRISLFGANASGSSAGATTITHAQWTHYCDAVFAAATGVDLTGGVAAAFVQAPTATGTGTTGTITLAAPGSANNRPISGWRNLGSTTMAPRANWTELDELTDQGDETQYRGDAFETTATVTWSGSAAWGGIAAELKAAPDDTPTVSQLMRHGKWFNTSGVKQPFTF